MSKLQGADVSRRTISVAKTAPADLGAYGGVKNAA
jgi:hypothetical protein